MAYNGVLTLIAAVLLGVGPSWAAAKGFWEVESSFKASLRGTGEFGTPTRVIQDDIQVRGKVISQVDNKGLPGLRW